jgi:multidrug resistance efflux pump
MKEKKLQFLLVVFILIVAVSGCFLIFSNNSVEVSAMKSYKGSITKTIEITGIINSSDVEVIPLESGVNVVKTYVKENDHIEKDQLLAELDVAELYILLEKSELNLEELNTKFLDIVQNNSDIILLNNTLSRSKEEYSKISEELLTAKDDLNKAEILYEESVISKAEYDKYASAVNDLTSRLKTAELNLNDASVNYKNNEEQKIQEKLSIERQIKALNLDIESINNKIKDSKVYSSVEGIVTEFPIKESRKTLNGENITIHGTSSYELTALVSQQDAVFIKEGQQSIVTVDGTSTIYEGIVSYVSRTARTDDSGSMLPKIEIKIKITNPDDYINFGYEGEAKVIIDSQEDVVVVKNESIKKEGNKEFVFLLNGTIANKTYVETGITDGYLINIKSGINESDVVIVNPPVDLTDGIKVKMVE